MKKIIIVFSLIALIAAGFIIWNSLDGAGVDNKINIKQQITADNGVKIDCHIMSNANMHHQYIKYKFSLSNDQEKSVLVTLTDPDEHIYKNPLKELKLINTENNISKYKLGNKIFYIDNDSINLE